jgi:hypothetical protein
MKVEITPGITGSIVMTLLKGIYICSLKAGKNEYIFKLSVKP